MRQPPKESNLPEHLISPSPRKAATRFTSLLSPCVHSEPKRFHRCHGHHLGHSVYMLTRPPLEVESGTGFVLGLLPAVYVFPSSSSSGRWERQDSNLHQGSFAGLPLFNHRSSAVELRSHGGSCFFTGNSLPIKTGFCLISPKLMRTRFRSSRFQHLNGAGRL